MLTLIYDVQLKRPACALLQAAYKCDHGALSRLFSSERWLTYPTPGMQRISGTREEWERVAAMKPLEGA